MKRLRILLLVLVFALSFVGACVSTDNSGGSVSDSGTETVKYTFTLSSEAGKADGDSAEYLAGESVTIPENQFINEGYVFMGWTYEESVYQPGDPFVMPEKNVEMVAYWVAIPEDPQPSFSQSEYEYDKLGGMDLELPLDLDGADLFYVELDEEILTSLSYSYNEETGCLVINSKTALALSFGEHVVTVITDAESEEPVSCTVVVTQSLKTTFDEESVKPFVYGMDGGVTFSVDYNTTTPVALMMGDVEVDEKYYSYDESSFTVSADWLSHFGKATSYSLYLSNNDVHEFTITTNVIFATDYDFSVIHDSTQSNIGHNPLYQYSDNVSIVDGPEGMSGNVLKITPNTQDVLYDCHGYLTLRRDDWSTTWYQAGFLANKYYVITFDYMTEGTSVGEFYYGSASASSSFKVDLLLGEENDGVVRRVVATVSYDQIETGLFLWAKFIGGGGCVYVDNFTIAQLDAIPTISASGDYGYIGDYSLNFDNATLAFEVLLDGQEVEYDYDAENKLLTLPEEELADLEGGQHTVTVKTGVGDFTATFRAIDNRIASLEEKAASYFASKQSSVVLKGSFTEGLKITSLKVKDVAYDNGYTGGWDFYHANEQAEYVQYATLTAGLQGSGSITINGELLDMFWGEIKFVAEISNGTAIEFSVVNEETVFLSNYDSLTMKGVLNGGFAPGSPLSSGMFGSTQVIEARADGKGNALYYKGTENSADLAAITLRMNAHAWEWYTVQGSEDNLYRITFEYQIKDLPEKSAYLFFIIPNGTVIEDNFFGQYDEIVKTADWTEVRYYLNTDGAVHSFDSGWYTWNSVVTNIKIALPLYSASENKYFMLDELKIVKTPNVLKDVTEYQIKQSEPVTFDIGTASLTALTVDGNELAYELKDGIVTLSAQALDALSLGTHVVKAVTSYSTYMTTINVSDSRVAILTQTTADVLREQGSLKLAGTFSANLNVLSVTRYGADGVWDTNPGTLRTEYVTVCEDGLLLSAELINMVYRTSSFVVAFDNGKSVEFALTSNVWYYSNYDEANVFVDIPGNSVIYQDRAMVEVVEVSEGDSKIKYTPSNAVLGHSVQAMNGNGTDNCVFTFVNRSLNTSIAWYDFAWVSNDIIYYSFEYEIVAPEGTQPNYAFNWWSANGVINTVPLTGSGVYTFVKPACEVSLMAINCAVASPELIEGTYMYIDAIAVGYYADKYLDVHGASVTRGGGAVTLPGKFEGDLTVKSLTRFGPNFWDNSKVTSVQLDASLVTLSENGLTVSAELVDKVYETEVFMVTLSNGGVVRFTLTSNVLYYSDFDLHSIHEQSQGNVRTCQDTSMWEIVDDNGNNKIKYTPANATLGHSANGAADNGCFTVSNTSLGNHWWLEYAFDTTKTLEVFFDYQVVLGEGKDSYFLFDAIDTANVHYTVKLEGSGSFKTEIDLTKIVGFRIYCPSGSNELIEGSYMLIDNFGFGYKA